MMEDTINNQKGTSYVTRNKLCNKECGSFPQNKKSAKE